MPLNDSDYTKLQTILQGLEGELPRLNDRSAQFVRDQIKREKEWGQDIMLSPRQWEWLESLYQDKVGSLPAQGRTAGKMTDEEVDIDDEIPF